MFSGKVNLKKKIPFTPRKFVSRLVRISAVVFGDDFNKVVNAFLLFCINLPFEKGLAFQSNKLVSPSPKDA